jgi:hypothetical protein
MAEDVSAGMCYRATLHGWVKVSRHWNRLTLVADLGRKPYGTQRQKKHMIRCRCMEGNVVDIPLDRLRRGETRSCGCLNREEIRRRSLTHGQKGTPLYECWLNMRRRCRDPNATGYKNYGDRGIKVCSEWEDFSVFRAWALETGWKPGLTIERKKNHLGYSPENCEWTDRRHQNRNRRNNRLVTAWGETKCLAAWADNERCQVSASALWKRLNRDWSVEDAISLPSRDPKR